MQNPPPSPPPQVKKINGDVINTPVVLLCGLPRLIPWPTTTKVGFAHLHVHYQGHHLYQVSLHCLKFVEIIHPRILTTH